MQLCDATCLQYLKLRSRGYNKGGKRDTVGTCVMYGTPVVGVVEHDRGKDRVVEVQWVKAATVIAMISVRSQQ